MLNSSIVLSEKEDSSITYEITIYNSTKYPYYFKDVTYAKMDDNSTYTNENIVYRLDDRLKQNDILNPKGDVTFCITFYYKDTSNIDEITLDSFLNFNFKLSSYVVAEYDYTRTVEKFEAPYDGEYELEVWGAQGGISILDNVSNQGGFGGYSVGTITLKKNEILYVVVGGNLRNDTLLEGGYNGGGYSYSSHLGCGGGATSIYKTLILDGQLQNYENNKEDIVIVAGGGGGGQTYKVNDYSGTFVEGDFAGIGGHGGGFIGGNGNPNTDKVYGYGTGGTQEKGGSACVTLMPSDANSVTEGQFGLGATVKYYYDKVEDYLYSSGGGGGFFGGGALEHAPAGGGSGYIGHIDLVNKYMVCYNGTTSNEETTKTISNENVSEEAKSDYSKIGNGYARITYMGDV